MTWPPAFHSNVEDAIEALEAATSVASVEKRVSTYKEAGSGPNVEGIWLPPGALNTYFAGRDMSSLVRAEVPGFGDSTLFGSGGLYSIFQRLRERAVGAGYVDGGKGMFAGGESAIGYDFPVTEVNGFVSTTFAGSPDQFDNTHGQYWYDVGTTPGHTLTLQFRSTCLRLWYSKRANAGEFTYAVDGGSTVTVDANKATGDGTCNFVYIDGLTAGVTHTIVITNRGGRTATAPASIQASEEAPATGSLTAATYYYKATNIFSGGETVGSPSQSVVVNGGGRQVTVLVPDIGQSSVKIYRTTSISGPWEYVPGATPSYGGGYFFMADTGTAVSAGVNPPTTGTTNLNTSAKACYIAAAPMNATGLVFQKYATSGDTMQQFLNTPVASASALGLVYDGSGPYDAASYTVDTEPDEDGRVNPVLAYLQLGFNDLSSLGSSDVTVFVNGIRQFAAMCEAAGCAGIVSSGNLPTNPTKWTLYGDDVQLALRNTALGLGLVFVDPYSAIEPYTNGSYYQGGDPHLSKAQYQAQADYLWDNLLSA